MWNYALDLALLAHPILVYLAAKNPKMALLNSSKNLFYLSFLGLLALRYTTASPSTINAALDTPLEACTSYDQPNPIAHLYPGNATGTLNGTVSILPISLSLARSLIPQKYRILEHAYRALLPDFPADMYPAVFQAQHDHDVQAFGYKIPDFSRAGIEFPFLDLLADNTTSFKWAPSMLMTATNPIALSGALNYGTHVYASTFSPSCDAYVSGAEPGSSVFGGQSVVDVNVNGVGDGAAASTLFSRAEIATPLVFFKNVTNQPTFADGRTCDNMIRLFNTSVSQAPWGIEEVKGDVAVRMWPLGGEMKWEGVEGLRFDSAFIENNYLPCEGFRGYDGKGL